MLPTASSLRARAAAATVLAAFALAGLAAPTPASYATAAENDPLTVEIASVSPAVIPTRGRITVTGSVTNDTDEQWRVIKLYPLTSTRPFTTPEELTVAAATDPGSYIGNRITSVADTIDVLDPGESATFAVSVNRGQLPVTGEPGVYWLGVHALGETDAGREEIPTADGRDRVFVPLRDAPARKKVRRQPEPTLDTALVVPLRHPVEYAADGSIADPDSWATDLELDGGLGRMVSLAAAAGTRPLTWLVDPAVTDAVARIGRDNPPRSLADSPSDPTDQPTDQPTDEPTDDPGASPSDPDAAPAPVAPAPSGWLGRLRQAVAGDQLLVLPYGDLDVAAAAASDPGLYRLARRRSGRTTAALALPAQPVVAPPGGLLDEAAFRILPDNTTVLASDRLLDKETRATSPAVVRAFGRRIYLANTAVLQGSGPQQDSFLDVRQRLLAESLVRLLGKRGPLVVNLPVEAESGWGGLEAAQLFAALDEAWWVRPTTLDGLQGRRARPIAPTQLRYPARVNSSELSGDVLAGARELVARGRLLDGILPHNDTIAARVEDEALTTVAYDDRADPFSARRTADRARAWIDSQLAQITVETPPSVTLSSDSGRLSADVVNGLDTTVRVRVQATSDPGLDITATPLQELGPGERATLQMEATSTNLSVHTVTLLVADEEGRPVGPAATFPLRANRVSQVIWVVIGVGALLLSTTIGVRLVRRIRRGFAARRIRARAAR